MSALSGAAEEFEEFSDAVVCFEWVTEFEVEADGVGISAADAGDFGEAGGDEFRDDFLHHAFGDPDERGDLSESGFGIAVEAEQDVHVVGEERPAWRVGAWVFWVGGGGGGSGGGRGG